MTAFRSILPVFLAAVACTLPGCSTVESLTNLLPESRSRGEAPPKAPSERESRNVVSAAVDIGRLVILRNNKTIATIPSSKPLIVRYGFWKGTDQVVLYSTDSAGESIIELFNVSGAQRVAGIAPSAVKDGKPDWAASVVK